MSTPPPLKLLAPLRTVNPRQHRAARLARRERHDRTGAVTVDDRDLGSLFAGDGDRLAAEVDAARRTCRARRAPCRRRPRRRWPAGSSARRRARGSSRRRRRDGQQRAPRSANARAEIFMAARRATCVPYGRAESGPRFAGSRSRVSTCNRARFRNEGCPLIALSRRLTRDSCGVARSTVGEFARPPRITPRSRESHCGCRREEITPTVTDDISASPPVSAP